MSNYPRVRWLDLQPVYHQGQRMWLLRDPLELDQRQLILPPLLAHMLRYLDGEHSLDEIQQALSADAGFSVPAEAIAEALEELDKAYLLDNARAQAAQDAQLDAYRAQPFRPPALADLSYPGQESQLVQLFEQYAAGDDLGQWNGWTGRGIVSPHIDYQRGGPVYARVWNRSAESLLAADLVIILGTDHNGSPGSITLTRQPYATPFGVLPTDLGVINHLAAAIGETNAFAEELHHRAEHSVELSTVWLHDVFHQAGQPPCPVVPILVGSFHHFLGNGSHPSQDETLQNFLTALREATAGRRVVIVGSVDLAHVGPAFGDTFPMDAARRSRLENEDEKLIESILTGDADGFYRRIAQVRDRNRICGFAPLYLMLSYLGPTTGHYIDYRHCPADDQDTSLVSICGLLLE
ncbi:MAG: AmmeMemoRadiSam system protein B [Chloroflexota bacterium]